MRTIDYFPDLLYQRYDRLQKQLRRRRRELLLFCEHRSTITAGIGTEITNLKSTEDMLKNQGIDFIHVRRGGDLTAHEKGQCVIYPHIDLRKRSIPAGMFFQNLLAITAKSIAETWGCLTLEQPGSPGLYVDSGHKKIVSIGIFFKGFFTSSGLAININNNLSTFQHIHACGLKNVQVSSLSNLGYDTSDIKVRRFKASWQEHFKTMLDESTTRPSESETFAAK